MSTKSEHFLVVTCKRKHTTHVLVRYEGFQLTLTFGTVDACAFHGLHTEPLLFSDHPEMKDLYDGVAWDMDGVMKLLDDCCFQDSAVYEWVDNELVVDPAYSIAVKEAYAAYWEWCQGREIEALMLRGFEREMAARGIQTNRGMHRVVRYVGVRLKGEQS